MDECLEGRAKVKGRAGMWRINPEDTVAEGQIRRGDSREQGDFRNYEGRWLILEELAEMRRQISVREVKLFIDILCGAFAFDDRKMGLLNTANNPSGPYRSRYLFRRKKPGEYRQTPQQGHQPRQRYTTRIEERSGSPMHSSIYSGY
jgi:hypothetical protein